jgi:hypothetical protein
MYWGASVGTQFTGSQPPFSMTAETDFANRDAGGKDPSIVGWGSNFYSSAYCSGYCNFTPSLYSTVRNNGQIPWISWQSTSTDGGSGYTDQQIADGAQDAYITKWAEAAKAWGQSLFLRFDWEMNGNWFRWSPGLDGNTAASYVAMWRHVHDIFTSVGATNVSWVWCPNIDPNSSLTSLASLYPGDAYVDWTCLDGYNGDDPWHSFQHLFHSTYKTITQTIAPSKPMIIGEVGSTEAGGSKATWISKMFNVLPTSFPDVHGLLWYDVKSAGPGGHTDWPIESSSSSISAFTSGVANSMFRANEFATLDGVGVPVPPAAS